MRIKFFTILILTSFVYASGQTVKTPTHKIYIDVGHQEKFWRDPSTMNGMHPDFIKRVEYMTREFQKTATFVNASFSYLKDEIKPNDLLKCNLLFIHIPSVKFKPEEVKTITNFITGGGSLFLVMDEDYWSTLEQSNVNDLVSSFGISFGGPNPDTLSGGHTNINILTPKPLKITYHGARTVSGGTPFCFNDRTDEFPFGTFLQLTNGGKLIVMSDGMVSLYMTDWEGVKGYQCQEFMHDALQWLLKK